MDAALMRIDEMIEGGASIDEIDEEVIEPSHHLSSEAKAALWLYAWARQPLDVLRRETHDLVSATAAVAVPTRALRRRRRARVRG